MKKLFLAAVALLAGIAHAATTVPVQLLSPQGSSAGQAIISAGPNVAPTWGYISFSTLSGIVPIANGGTGASTQSAALTNLLGASSIPVANGGTGATTAATARANLGLGTAATANTGTSGATVPLLNGTNTWAAAQTFSVRPTFNGATPWDSANLPSTAGRLLNIQVFTASGTYTPTSGTAKIRIRLQAAGGGGGGAPAAGASAASIGQTGSAGAYCEAWYTGTQTTQAVTIGAGGTAGTTSTGGGNGGPSSVGTLVSATGGGGGAVGTAAAAPFVSVGTTSQISSCTFGGGAAAIVSGTGPIGNPGAVISNTVGYSGLGASTAYGYGGQARGLGPASSTAGSNATGYGASGSGGSVGASGAAAAGGAGAPALVVIEEYSN